jgi:group I intron endonuclease
MRHNIRQQFSNYFIYKTTCLVNNKIYIGCHATNNLEDGYLGSGKLLFAAIKKYGKENFTREILETFSNPEDMFDRERVLVNEDLISSGLSYNLVVGGSGGFKVQDVDDWKRKLSASRKGRVPPNKGKSQSADTKKKISESLKGKPAWNKGLPGTWVGKTHSEESKRKISISKKGQSAGEKNPMFGKSAVAGRKWYNDNIKTYYLFPDDPATAGLTAGRLKKSSS